MSFGKGASTVRFAFPQTNRGRKGLEVVVEPFVELSPGVRSQVHEETFRLRRFLGSESATARFGR